MPTARTDRRPVAAIVMLLLVILAGCGSSESSTGSGPATGDTATRTPVDDGSGTSGSAATGADRPRSAGVDIDERWPAAVWVPVELMATGASVDEADGWYQAQITGTIERDRDDVVAQITEVNGAPDDESTNAAGTLSLVYEDLYDDHLVVYDIIDDVAPGVLALTVRVTSN